MSEPLPDEALDAAEKRTARDQMNAAMDALAGEA